jgi:hypothetical protein
MPSSAAVWWTALCAASELDNDASPALDVWYPEWLCQLLPGALMSELTIVPDLVPAVDDAIPVAVLRPTMSAVWWRGAIAVSTAMLAVVAWRLHLRTLPLLMACFALAGLVGCIRAVFGAVHVHPAGIRFRRRLGWRVVSWPDVFQLVVHERLLCRSVYLKTETGRRYDLVVPRSPRLVPDRAFDREVDRLRHFHAQSDPTGARPQSVGRAPRRWLVVGLVVGALLLVSVPDRPWGWVSGAEAAATPSACALTDSLASRLDARRSAQATPPDTTTTRACLWELPQGVLLDIVYQRFPRQGLHSGIDLAKRGLAEVLDNALTEINSELKVDAFLQNSTADAVHPVDAQRAIGLAGTLIVLPRGLVFVARTENVALMMVIGGTADRAKLNSVAAYAAGIAEGQVR